LSTDADPKWKPLGKSAAANRTDPKSQPSNPARPFVASQQEGDQKGAAPNAGESPHSAPVALKKHSVLLVGPAGCGKTLLLASRGDACAHHVAGDWEIDFSQVNLAPLRAARNQGQTARRGLARSITNPRIIRSESTRSRC
jgi:hypothetical protein